VASRAPWHPVGELASRLFLVRVSTPRGWPLVILASSSKTAGTKTLLSAPSQLRGASPAAALLVADGLPITVVSAMLDRALTSTTLNTYAHVLPDTNRFAADAMERLFGK
jgi:hypothetical protein